MTREAAVAVLQAEEYQNLHAYEELPPPSGRARVETIGTIDAIDCRAATKTALNYLAAITNPGIARMPQFHEARRYARYGT